MCNIAGYAGTKRAAPILIEMLKKQEFFDGGLSTGIATVDNKGNLYHAKVLGSVEDLLSKTDAINFPGNVGIIHSRPDDSFIEHAHPFIGENEKTALIENGNGFREERLMTKRDEITNTLLNDGVEFYSAKMTDRVGGNQLLPDGRCVSYDDVYVRYIEYLRKKLMDKPWPMDGLGGGIFVRNTSTDLVHPNVKAVYDALWQFKKEGILKMEDKDHELSWLPGRLLKRTFFWI